MATQPKAVQQTEPQQTGFGYGEARLPHCTATGRRPVYRRNAQDRRDSVRAVTTPNHK